MYARLHALVMPVFIAAACAAYWYQVSGARSPVVLVPSAILILIVIFLAIIVFQDMRRPQKPPTISFVDLAKPLALIGLCFAYFFSFSIIGFTFSNVLFVLFSALLMRMGFYKALIAAFFTSLALFLVSRFLSLDVPSSFWMFA